MSVKKLCQLSFLIYANKVIISQRQILNQKTRNLIVFFKSKLQLLLKNIVLNLYRPQTLKTLPLQLFIRTTPVFKKSWCTLPHMLHKRITMRASKLSEAEDQGFITVSRPNHTAACHTKPLWGWCLCWYVMAVGTYDATAVPHWLNLRIYSFTVCSLTLTLKIIFYVSHLMRDNYM